MDKEYLALSRYCLHGIFSKFWLTLFQKQHAVVGEYAIHAENSSHSQMIFSCKEGRSKKRLLIRRYLYPNNLILNIQLYEQYITIIINHQTYRPKKLNEHTIRPGPNDVESPHLTVWFLRLGVQY